MSGRIKNIMEYNYRLVVFVNQKKTKEIDIVPSTWLHTNNVSNKLLCKFMPGPYNNEISKKLLHMVKNGSPPEENWPSYPVELVGRAFTYEEAEEKAITLEKEPYAYSTENEYRAKQKAKEDKKYFQFKSISQASVSQQLNKIDLDINNDFTKNNHITSKSMASSSHKNYTQKKDKKDSKTRKRKISVIKKGKNTYNNIVDSSDDDYNNNDLKKHCKIEIKKSKLSELQKNKVMLSSNDLSDCSTSLFSDNEAHAKSKLLKKPVNVAAISSDNENFEINNSKQIITDYKEKKITKSQNTHEAEINNNDENPSILSLKTNNTEEDRLCHAAEKYYKSLSKQICNVQGQVVNISLQIKELQQSIKILTERSNNDDTSYSDDNDNEISLPLMEYTDFEALNVQLKDKVNFRQKIIRRLSYSLNRKATVTRNVGQILRMYFSQDLAIKFTTVKAVPGKHIFRGTELYLCMQEVLTKNFTEADGTPLSFRSFQESVQSVLNNAKDWNGKGNARKITQKE